MFGLFKLSAAINGAALLIVVYFLVAKGWRAINWTFLSQPPIDSMTKGGNPSVYRRDTLSQHWRHYRGPAHRCGIRHLSE